MCIRDREESTEEQTSEEASTEEPTTQETTPEETTTEAPEWSEQAPTEDTKGLTFSFSEDGQTVSVTGFDGSRSIVAVSYTHLVQFWKEPPSINVTLSGNVICRNAVQFWNAP